MYNHTYNNIYNYMCNYSYNYSYNYKLSDKPNIDRKQIRFGPPRIAAQFSRAFSVRLRIPQELSGK